MNESARKTGIDVIGDVQWGAHFCQFYQTKQDLIEILVPYFKAGLENNEFCIWITSEPLSKMEAEESLRQVVPDLNLYIGSGQIEIFPYADWYFEDGTFDQHKALKYWIDRLESAQSNGYVGLRVTGNTSSLDREKQSDLLEYEATINAVINNYPMLAICSYSLPKCDASLISDVMSIHKYALTKHAGVWSLLENLGSKPAKERLRQTFPETDGATERMESRLAWIASFPERNPNPVLEMDISGRVHYFNPAALKLLPDLRVKGPDHPWLAGWESVVRQFLEGGEEKLVRDVTLDDVCYEQTMYYLADTKRIRMYSNDVTEQRRAEEALQKAKLEAEHRSAELVTTLDAMEDLIVVYDSMGNLTYGNAAMRNFFGIDDTEEDWARRAELIYRYAVRKPDGQVINLEERPVMRALHGEVVRDETLLIIDVSSQETAFAVSASPIIAGGKIVGAVSVSHDITERKRIQDKLEKTFVELEYRTEELEAMNEELTVLNEEIEAANSELRTANELLNSEILRRKLVEEELSEAHIEVSRLFEREHHIADVLQKALVPADIPAEIGNLRIGARYQAALSEAEVGGDFYDVFELDGGKVGILIGDVAGKGLPAAIRVGLARYAVRSYAYVDATPSKVLALANEALCKDPWQESNMLTALFAVIDAKSGSITYACAGHHPPMIRRAAGHMEELSRGGMPLGVFNGLTYDDNSATMEHEDTIIVLTDGVSEARSPGPDLFGLDRIFDYLSSNGEASPDDVALGLLIEATRHAGGQLQDDAAIVVIKLEHPDGRRMQA